MRTELRSIAVALALTLAVAGGLVGLSVLISADQAIDQARGPQTALIKFRTITRRDYRGPDPQRPNWRVLSRPAPMRDVAAWGDELLAATDGGLWVLDSRGRPKALLSALNGLAQGPVRAVQPLGNRALVASAEGLAILQGTEANRLEFEDPAVGRAVDLALGGTTGDRLLWLTEDGRIFALEDDGARELARTDSTAPRALYNGATELLVACGRNGVISLRDDQQNEIKLGLGPGSDEANAMLDAGGVRYVALANGLAALDETGARLVIGERFISALAALGPDVYAASIAGELFRVGERRPLARLNEPIRCLAAWDDRLLVGADSGLYVLAPGSDLQPLALAEQGLCPAENHAAALALLGGERVLLGGFDHGVELLHAGDAAVGDRFERFGPSEAAGINRIVVDQDGGAAWIATTAGAFQCDLQGRVLRKFTTADGLIHDNVADILITRPGGGGKAVLFATAAGLSRLDGGAIRSIYHFHGLVNNHVYALAPLSETTVLAGTLGGLNQVRNMDVSATHTREDGGLRAAWISALLPLEQGVLIGTYGGGLSLYSAGSVAAIADEFADAEVNFNALGRWDEYWLAGTLRNGLLVGKGADRCESLTEGLPSRNVTAVLPLGRRLLLATDAGLLLLPGDDLERLFAD